MIALGVVVLLLLAVGGAVVVGIAGLVGRGGDTGLSLAGGVAVAGGAVLVLGTGAVLLTFGVGRGGADGDDEERPVRSGGVQRQELVGPPAAFAATAHVDARRGELQPPAVVEGVAGGDVVLVAGRGFPPSTHGRVAQCDGYAARRCDNVVDVRTDEAGRFDLPYRVVDVDRVLVVDIGERRTGVAFAAHAPAGLEVAGDAVEVAAPSVTDGWRLLSCPAGTGGLSGCSLAATGAGSTAVSAPTGDGLLVLVDAGGTPMATVRSSRPPAAAARPTDGPDLDPRRLTTLLVVAFAFAAGAVVLGRRTDWRPPAELSTGD